MKQVTVKIMGKPSYQAESVSAAIASLPDSHPPTRIYLDGSDEAEGIPETQLVGERPARYGIKATRGIHVGDLVEVIHRGVVTEGYCLVRRKTMRVEKLTGAGTVASGDAEDGQDFVRGGSALFAILGDVGDDSAEDGDR